MEKTSITIHDFVSNADAMNSVAGLVINPTIYLDKNIREIIQDFNKVMESQNIPYILEPSFGVVYYLRFEAERLDRALYILSCLTSPTLEN